MWIDLYEGLLGGTDRSRGTSAISQLTHSSVHSDLDALAGEVKYCIAKLFSGDVKYATALDY